MFFTFDIRFGLQSEENTAFFDLVDLYNYYWTLMMGVKCKLFTDLSLL